MSNNIHGEKFLLKESAYKSIIGILKKLPFERIEHLVGEFICDPANEDGFIEIDTEKLNRFTDVLGTLAYREIYQLFDIIRSSIKSIPPVEIEPTSDTPEFVTTDQNS